MVISVNGSPLVLNLDNILLWVLDRKSVV